MDMPFLKNYIHRVYKRKMFTFTNFLLYESSRGNVNFCCKVDITLVYFEFLDIFGQTVKIKPFYVHIHKFLILYLYRFLFQFTEKLVLNLFSLMKYNHSIVDGNKHTSLAFQFDHPKIVSHASLHTFFLKSSQHNTS